MPVQRRRVPRGRPRHAAPKALPDDLYDYNDYPARQSRNPSPDASDIEKLSVLDNWPDSIPVTVAEVDIFERYFGDVIDRLFQPVAAPRADEPALHSLPPDGNKRS